MREEKNILKWLKRLKEKERRENKEIHQGDIRGEVGWRRMYLQIIGELIFGADGECRTAW